ncbi:MAG: acyl-CoA thioesterase [Gemmatimonadota bacterium]
MSAIPPIEGFPIAIEVSVAWGEMDALGHVNNVAYFRYMESARIAYLAAIGFLGGDGNVGPILASVQCRFRRPVIYPERLRVAARADDLGDDRFTVAHDIMSVTRGDVVAHGRGIVVAYDYAAAAKTSLPDEVRLRILELQPSLRAGGA